MSERDFLQEVGRPTVIERDRTVFDYGPRGWLRGCTGYGYHVVGSQGEVGVRSFYFKDDHWVGASRTIIKPAGRFLRWEDERDRRLIQQKDGTNFSPPCQL